MKTQMYCYLEDSERRLLPSGVRHYETAFEDWLGPDSTAVVEIDMHRGHLGPDACPVPVPRARAR
ncbi:MAG: hypothetical protein ABIJ48_10640, partial [Actinomycetota bacterium]